MANHFTHNPLWTIAAPLFGIVTLLLAMFVPALSGATLLLVLGLFGSVIAAVHHAEVIALRVGEPFGTLVLALAVTAIEVALIVTMMLAGGESTAGLPRDTVFAAVMLILNGIIGFSLLAGSRRHSIQRYRLDGVTAALTTAHGHRGADPGAAECHHQRIRAGVRRQAADVHRHRHVGVVRIIHCIPDDATSRLFFACGRRRPDD